MNRKKCINRKIWQGSETAIHACMQDKVSSLFTCCGIHPSPVGNGENISRGAGMEVDLLSPTTLRTTINQWASSLVASEVDGALQLGRVVALLLLLLAWVFVNRKPLD